MRYFTYILECADTTLYIGKTTDPQKRLRQHNGEIKGGAKYTRARRPVTFCLLEEYPTLSEALKREYELKLLSRKEKLQIIKSSRLSLV